MLYLITPAYVTQRAVLSELNLHACEL